MDSETGSIPSNVASQELDSIESLLAGYEAVKSETEPVQKRAREPRARVPAEKLASKDDIQTAFVQLTDFLALRLGEHWKADEKEAEHVAKSWAALFDRLGPEVWDSTVAAAVIAGSSLLLYAAPRVILQVNMDKERKRKAAEDGGTHAES